MTLTKSRSLSVPGIQGIIPKASVVEPGSSESASLPLVVEGVNDVSVWTYSAVAEDHGSAGGLDLSPGLIYSGPGGAHVSVQVRGVDATESAVSATVPESTDSAALTLFKNSDLAGASNEGLVSSSSETTDEGNVDATVGPLVPGDVLRIGYVFSGEEADADLAVTNAGMVVIS